MGIRLLFYGSCFRGTLFMTLHYSFENNYGYCNPLLSNPVSKIIIPEPRNQANMMTRLTGLIALIAATALLTNCSPSRQSSTLYSDNYDPAKNHTSVMIFPYGQVTIPGQWKKTSYNNISKQYFFRDADSTVFAVALNHWNNYEFFKEGMTSYEFVKTFYEWDASYLQGQMKAQTKLVREDKEKNFIVWSLKKAPDVDGCFLFGLKNKTVYNLYLDTNKWTETEKTELLEKIFTE